MSQVLKLHRFILVVSILALSAEAFAYKAVVNFTIDGFESGAPEGTVSGSIEVELNDANNEVIAITSVALAINGHTFQISELGFSEYRNFNIIGAQGEGLGSATGISHGSPFDFWILWNKDSGLPKEFAYTGGIDGIHQSNQFQAFSIVVVP